MCYMLVILSAKKIRHTPLEFITAHRKEALIRGRGHGPSQGVRSSQGRGKRKRGQNPAAKEDTCGEKRMHTCSAERAKAA